MLVYKRRSKAHIRSQVFTLSTAAQLNWRLSVAVPRIPLIEIAIYLTYTLIYIIYPVSECFRHILCTDAMDFHDRRGKEVVMGFVSSKDSPVGQFSPGFAGCQSSVARIR